MPSALSRRALREWPDPEAFSGTFCRRVRLRWNLHAHSVAWRSSVGQGLYMRWEEGRVELPLGGKLLIWTALRQLIAEQALIALEQLADVVPHARVRVAYDREAAELRRAGKRPPPPPPLAPIPKLAALKTFV